MHEVQANIQVSLSSVRFSPNLFDVGRRLLQDTQRVTSDLLTLSGFTQTDQTRGELREILMNLNCSCRRAGSCTNTSTRRSVEHNREANKSKGRGEKGLMGSGEQEKQDLFLV